MNIEDFSFLIFLVDLCKWVEDGVREGRYVVVVILKVFF